MSEVKRDVCHGCVWLPRDVHCSVCDPEIGYRKELDAQRLRADTAEAELKGLKHPMNSAQQLRKDLAAAEQRIAELKHDAARWNAFIDCARIRFFGWAGYEEKGPYGNSPGNYRHFGGEFWTIHSAPTADKEKAAEILNGFADAALAVLNPNPEAESHVDCGSCRNITDGCKGKCQRSEEWSKS